MQNQEAAVTVVARVSSSRGERARVLWGEEELRAAVRVALLQSPDTIPVAGDWVTVRRLEEGKVLIESVLPRKTKISRRAAGREGKEQVLAANVDVALLVAGLDGDFNVRRLERYLAITHDGGVEPVVVLNKCDLCADVAGAVALARAVAGKSQVFAVSAADNIGMEDVFALLTDGRTAVLLGSSGAGKSTLLNRIIGRDAHRTGAVRESDARGQHTTTDRELILLPSGAALIDTPGLREIQLMVGADALDAVFDEIAVLARTCRFKDCTHVAEPGCAVREAVPPERLASFQKLTGETAWLSNELTEKQRWRSIHKAAKRFYRERNR
ncbi:MAG: ribosome small subunit-dependent GTPase A [Acidobacteriota bacterium]